MHQQKGKKILTYFFLLFLLGSINNISLNNLRFEKIRNINIVGLKDSETRILLQKIKDLNLGIIFSINRNKIMNKINSNNLIENYDIFKKYPSSLVINIEKTKFLAKVNSDGKIFLLGSNGKLSNNIFLNNHLPFIFGKLDVNEFLIFKNIVDNSKISYEEIKNFYFFSSKRWDIELKNNIIIKLPSKHAKESLELALDFLHNNKIQDIKIIDARIKNQIILDD